MEITQQKALVGYKYQQQ